MFGSLVKAASRGSVPLQLGLLASMGNASPVLLVIVAFGGFRHLDIKQESPLLRLA